jgi:DNA-binding transcriptional LysR family regulator
MFDDILSIKVFEKVATLQSFSNAAKALNFSQVMISKRIAKLEAQLGYKLFDRSTRTVFLTSDGHRYLESCSTILSAIDHEEHAINCGEGLSGVLRFAAPPFFSRYHIVPYLDAFLKSHPKLKLDLILTENEIDLIEEGVHFEIRVGDLFFFGIKKPTLLVNDSLLRI